MYFHSWKGTKIIAEVRVQKNFNLNPKSEVVRDTVTSREAASNGTGWLLYHSSEEMTLFGVPQVRKMIVEDSQTCLHGEDGFKPNPGRVIKGIWFMRIWRQEILVFRYKGCNERDWQ